MNIELTNKEFRLLLDMVYIGNWVLNSARGDDRFEEYDVLQEKLFAHCAGAGLKSLIQVWKGHIFPSREYEEGGIHEAIADYEDAVFFDILAEELARRDMVSEQLNQDDLKELQQRMEEYISEFEQNGVQNISLDI
ncbi:MAG: hypothetical protein AB7D36_09805 [Oscillospiraceae bacterium]